MSQHDFDIANQTASNTRSDINLALKALGSLSSGATAPATTYANMLWYDTATDLLKMRSEANDAWIAVAYLNQSTDKFAVLDDTQVVSSGGTQTGLLGDQTLAAWKGGTGTIESLISPAKLRAASGGLVLLGSLNLTSGSAQTLSGLTLSDYKILYVVLEDVNVTESGSLHLEGSLISSTSTSYGVYTFIAVDVGSGVRLTPFLSTSAFINISSATSLSLALTSGSFVSGTAKFYGDK